ncbi:General transcription factor II-I repeat domain-containing protein 2 [Trachymyrmex cornetzi]|uniref:General transcription factor II-I repeat domain-containing protein 2 n=1 Tax=Trachymyrmex cornetzi TaxID=471704 RepID=A0A151IUI3_9HYME|nr:General transcription factor II-I repeat domain-containing protein 2 [Trachymyrmex cornetzi]
MTNHLNILNSKLQKTDQTISQLVSHIDSFRRKLVLFKRQLENNIIHFFPSCQILFEEHGTNCDFRKQLNIIESLIHQFNTRFSDFETLRQDLTLFENEDAGILSASTYAIEKINYADKPALLEEILNTKLKGKLLLDFQTRSIRDFEQLRREIEANYLGKRGTSHLQLEFNALKQKPGESAHTFGRRVDTLAMELYESLIEKRDNTSEQKRAILETIQDQALLNFELGLREDIKLVVRSQKYTSLQEAINAASAEEKVKGPTLRTNYNERYKNGQNQNLKNTGVQCSKCGKIGHLGRDCRSSRYATKFSLPRAEKPASINLAEKYCTYCKRAGHKRNECWSLNGRPDKDPKQRAKRDTDHRAKRVNSAIKIRQNKQQSESEESSYGSSEEEQERRREERGLRTSIKFRR